MGGKGRRLPKQRTVSTPYIITVVLSNAVINDLQRDESNCESSVTFPAILLIY